MTSDLPHPRPSNNTRKRIEIAAWGNLNGGGRLFPCKLPLSTTLLSTHRACSGGLGLSSSYVRVNSPCCGILSALVGNASMSSAKAKQILAQVSYSANFSGGQIFNSKAKLRVGELQDLHMQRELLEKLIMKMDRWLIKLQNIVWIVVAPIRNWLHINTWLAHNLHRGQHKFATNYGELF